MIPFARHGTLALATFALAACTRTDVCPAPAIPSAPRVNDPAVALEEVAHGHRSLYSLAEPGVGLAVVLNRTDPSGEAPDADAEGRIRRAERVCDDRAPSLTRVRDGLVQHYLPDFEYVPVVCEGLVCDAHGPMEYATSLRFVFERTADGGIALRTVLEVEDVAMMDEFVHAAWNWAENAALDLPGRCGAP